MRYSKAQYYKTAFFPAGNFYVGIEKVEEDADYPGAHWYWCSWKESGHEVRRWIHESDLENFVL